MTAPNHPTADEHTRGRRIAATLLCHAMGFRDCPREAIDGLVEGGHVLTLGKGQALARRGEAFDTLCVVLDGALEASVTSDDGRRNLAAFLNVGDLAGILAVLDGLPHQIDLFARRTGTRTLLIPGAHYRALCDTEPTLTRALVLQLSYRARLMYDRQLGDAAMPLAMRLARLLHLMVALGAGGPLSDDARATLRISQAELGDLMGVGRPRANAAAHQLRKEGLIELRYASIMIVNPDALRQRGGL